MYFTKGGSYFIAEFQFVYNLTLKQIGYNFSEFDLYIKESKWIPLPMPYTDDSIKNHLLWIIFLKMQITKTNIFAMRQAMCKVCN